VLFVLVTLHVASAQGITGQWTRSQGGAVVDVLDLSQTGNGYLIILREGFGRPAYASGFCIAGCGKTICGVQNTKGKAGLVELTPSGTSLHYRSYYDEGRTTWDGDFVRAQGATVPASPRPSTPAPSASQWIRSQGGTVIDVLTLTRDGNGQRIELREGFGKPVYSSGTCSTSGDTVTCTARSVSGKTGQIVLTIRGNSLHYRSVYDGGRSVWEGDFIRSEPVR